MLSSFSEVWENSLLESLKSSVAELIFFLSFLALVDLVGLDAIPAVLGLAPVEVVPDVDVDGIVDEGVGVGVGAVPLPETDDEPC